MQIADGLASMIQHRYTPLCVLRCSSEHFCIFATSPVTTNLRQPSRLPYDYDNAFYFTDCVQELYKTWNSLLRPNTEGMRSMLMTMS